MAVAEETYLKFVAKLKNKHEHMGFSFRTDVRCLIFPIYTRLLAHHIYGQYLSNGPHR